MSESDCPETILVVDDEPSNLELLTRHLSPANYRVVRASDAEDARRKVGEESPDLVLLDIFMPKVTGLELLQQLRADPDTEHLPVILISALNDSDHIVQGLRLGANDYLTRPLKVPELLARIDTQLKLFRLLKKLEHQNKILSGLAYLDELCGVYNRRAMFDTLQREIERCTRYGDDLSVMLIDINRFKHINDTYGHAMGDAVLSQFCDYLFKLLRSTDILFRYAGDEFFVILPDTDEQGALVVANRIDTFLAGSNFVHDDVSVPISVSIGCVAWDESMGRSAQEIFKRADKLMYVAKSEEKSRQHDGGASRVA